MSNQPNRQKRARETPSILIKNIFTYFHFHHPLPTTTTNNNKQQLQTTSLKSHNEKL